MRARFVLVGPEVEPQESLGAHLVCLRTMVAEQHKVLEDGCGGEDDD